jgi:ParB/RepB/Spo0J family partition protein
MNNTISYEFKYPDGVIVARMTPERLDLLDEEGKPIQSFTGSGDQSHWQQTLAEYGSEMEGDYSYGDKEMVSAMEGALNAKAHAVKPDKGARKGRAKKGEVDTQELGGQLLSGKVIELTPDQIKVGKNPRGETVAVERMAESLRKDGQIQNIVVAPAEKGKYLLIAGYRRVAGAVHNQEAFPNKPEYWTLRALVYEGDNPRIIAMKENIERIAMSHMAIARQYNEMVEVDGMEQKAVARLMNVTTTEVSNYLKLLDLPKKMQEWLDEGKLTYSTALKVAKFSPEDQKAAMANVKEQVAESEESAPQKRQGRRAVVDEAELEKAVRQARKPAQDEDVEEYEDEVEEDTTPRASKMTRRQIDDFLEENTLAGAPVHQVYIFSQLKAMFDGLKKETTVRGNIRKYCESLKKQGEK